MLHWNKTDICIASICYSERRVLQHHAVSDQCFHSLIKSYRVPHFTRLLPSHHILQNPSSSHSPGSQLQNTLTLLKKNPPIICYSVTKIDSRFLDWFFFCSCYKNAIWALNNVDIIVYCIFDKMYITAKDLKKKRTGKYT